MAFVRCTQRDLIQDHFHERISFTKSQSETTIMLACNRHLNHIAFYLCCYDPANTSIVQHCKSSNLVLYSIEQKVAPLPWFVHCMKTLYSFFQRISDFGIRIGLWFRWKLCARWDLEYTRQAHLNGLSVWRWKKPYTVGLWLGEELIWWTDRRRR